MIHLSARQFAKSAAMLMMSLAIGACASNADRDLATRTISLAEFSRTPADHADDPADAHPADVAITPSPAVDSVEAHGSATADASTASPQPPAASNQTSSATAPGSSRSMSSGNASRARLRPGDQVIVDSLIGQVSGRPLFADELLAPIADQLQRESEQLGPVEFQRRAAEIVFQHVREVVLNELFLAEAEASLTEQQQMGLLYLMRELQERTIAERGGVRVERERRLQEERGMTIEQFMELRKNELLIVTLLNEKVMPRVIVSWRDVEQEYERRRAEFNPPSTVTFKRISLFNDRDKELIDKAKSAFAAGASFEEVAAIVGQDNVSTLDPLTMGPGGVGDVQLIEAYRRQLQGLTVGQTTGAIELDRRTVWLHVASIDTPPQLTLYDVQLQLINELRQRRRDEERLRYIRTLFERGIYDELDQMAQRLLTVALMRYGRS